MTAVGGPDPAGVLFWGCGSQALVLLDALEAQGGTLTYVVSDGGETRFGGIDVVPWDVCMRAFVVDSYGWPSVVVAIGGGHGRARLERLSLLTRHGFRSLTLIHPAACVLSRTVIGEACQILARAVVGVGAQLGDAVIVNTGAIVDHETRVGNGSHVAPGAVLLGRVTLGECVFVGANATVLPDLTICSNVTIGAGALVSRSIETPGTYLGVPARRVEA